MNMNEKCFTQMPNTYITCKRQIRIVTFYQTYKGKNSKNHFQNEWERKKKYDTVKIDRTMRGKTSKI